MEKQLYTPYGFRDLLFEETWQHNMLQQKLTKVFRAYGYREAETPLVEYLDVFDEERGSVRVQDLYKFVDRDGELLTLRPDMTPALSRMASFCFRTEDLPVRIASSGYTFRYNSRYSAKQRQLKQTGIELYGSGSALEDAEVLAVAVEALNACQAEEFRITIGHARLSADLLDLIGVPAEDREEWRERIESKNLFALEQEAGNLHLHPDIVALLRLLTETGDCSLLARGLSLSEQIHAQTLAEDFAWLLSVAELLDAAGVEKDVLFDPGMRPELHYYTGIIFKGYVLGAAEPVLDGGRYDALLEQMGTDWAAVGFGIYQDRLLEAMRRQYKTEPLPLSVLLTGDDAALLTRRAGFLRSEGKDVLVVYGLSEQEAREYASAHACGEVLRATEEGWEIL